MARRRDGALKTLPARVRPDQDATTNFSPSAVVYPIKEEASAQVDSRPAKPRLDEGRLAPLVELARAGDPAAFEEIVQIMQGPVRAFARRMMRDPHLGDDAAQDTFLRMWKGLR